MKPPALNVQYRNLTPHGKDSLSVRIPPEFLDVLRWQRDLPIEITLVGDALTMRQVSPEAHDLTREARGRQWKRRR